MQLTKATISMVEMAMRFLHLILSALALAFVFGSFRVVKTNYTDDDELRQSVATPTTNFIILLTYSSMVYSFWYLVFVMWMHYAPRMSAKTSLAIDTLFAIAYLAGSIAFVCLPFHKDCDLFTNPVTKVNEVFNTEIEPMLRCDNMTTSIVLCFIIFALYVFSMMWEGCLIKVIDEPKDTTEMEGVLTPAANE